MKEGQWGFGGHSNPLGRCKHYSSTQGVETCHRGSAIRQLSVTEGCECGEVAREGEVAVGCQPSGWRVAVTEERDET